VPAAARDERVLRREHEERRAEQRVGRVVKTGSSSPLPSTVKDPRALGAADPVALHRQDALGPRLEQRHLVEQRVGVVGDLEEPLRRGSSTRPRCRSARSAVDHLLVREHGLVLRAPLDRRLLR
jgi:hypothetical protein